MPQSHCSDSLSGTQITAHLGATLLQPTWYPAAIDMSVPCHLVCMQCGQEKAVGAPAECLAKLALMPIGRLTWFACMHFAC